MDRICVNVKFAASQNFWLTAWITQREYKDVFQTGKLGEFSVAYIQPAGATIMYDCEARQWVTENGKCPLSFRYQLAAKEMTPFDRTNIQHLIRKCLATSYDLGEDE